MPDFHAIRRSNLDAVLSVSAAGMLTAGRDLRVRSMNAEAERLLGVSADEGIGRECREVFGPDLCTSGCAFRKTLLDKRPRRDFHIRVASDRGAPRELVFSTAYLEAPEGDEPEVVIAIRDVTHAEAIRRAMHDRWQFHELLCASSKMKEIVSLVRELAPYDSTVLVLGESGTGKELIARAVHAESPRKDKPFITVNCSAYSEGVLESELFGHIRGSFTGAIQDREGRFAAADGGTVFLDEIGEIPPSIQVKLLRVLQERTVERVGEHRSRRVDLRVVAATNRDLAEEVRSGRFREDLYYRLNVITVTLPPLRERQEDIPVLVDHFRETYAERMRKDVTGISEAAMGLMLRHDWPGNVRELENAVEHAVLRTRGPWIVPSDLPLRGKDAQSPAAGPQHLAARIDAALQASGGRIGRAAEILGVHRTTVWRHLRKA